MYLFVTDSNEVFEHITDFLMALRVLLPRLKDFGLDFFKLIRYDSFTLIIADKHLLEQI